MQSLDDRFDSKWELDEQTGCHVWIAGTFDTGYGSFCAAGRDRGSHRFALERAMGRPLAPGEQACHRCDNRACVNPEHLFPGTQADNMADRDSKGRQARGELQGSAKLNTGLVSQIRQMCLQGASQRTVARNFGISQSQVSNIVRRKFWKDSA